MPGSRDIGDSVPSKFNQEYETISKELWKHDAFKEHILNTIKGHVQIREEIQNIVWETLRSRILWLLLGGAFFLCTIFIKTYVEQVASAFAHSAVESKQVK